MAGLAASSGLRNFVGRIGATERPPCDTAVDDSWRARTGAASDVDDKFEVVKTVEEDETVRTGENDDIAEPGRAGKFLFAIVAFFCASMVSLREGFGGPVELLENPRPGRVVTASAFLGELGLSGAFSKSLC